MATWRPRSLERYAASRSLRCRRPAVRPRLARAGCYGRNVSTAGSGQGLANAAEHEGDGMEDVEERPDPRCEAQMLDRRITPDGVGGRAAAREEGPALPLGPREFVSDPDPGLLAEHLGMHGVAP